jgi:hypothetical protein
MKTEHAVEMVVSATDSARSTLNTEHHQLEKLPPTRHGERERERERVREAVVHGAGDRVGTPIHIHHLPWGSWLSGVAHYGGASPAVGPTENSII